MYFISGGFFKNLDPLSTSVFLLLFFFIISENVTGKRSHGTLLAFAQHFF